MGLFVPVPNRFCGIITNLTGQPTTTWGTAVASGAANTYGSYVECIGDTAYETFFMLIKVAAIGAAGSNPDAILTIGMDHSGATTYTDVTIDHLLVSGAGTTAMGAIFYKFPLYCPAGTAVAAKLSTARGSVTARVGIRLYGKPTHPEQVRAGTYVDSFGVTTSSSSGTAITPGTTSEGSAVTLASNITRDYWWWQGGMGCNNTTMAGGGLYTVLDVGVGTASGTADWIFENQPFAAWNTSEQTGNQLLPDHAYVFEVRGDGANDVFARSQGSGTADTGMSAAAYALGG